MKKKEKWSKKKKKKAQKSSVKYMRSLAAVARMQNLTSYKTGTEVPVPIVRVVVVRWE